MADILILNGGDSRVAVAYLEDPDGNLVPVRSRDPVDVMAAVVKAAGRVPQPPELGLGGELVAIQDARGYVQSYTYNPAGDELNKAKVEEYGHMLTAWNARLAFLLQLAQTLVKL